MKPPAFQFYADDFLAGTAEMTDAEVGLYVRLLCSQWSRGSIPNDVDEVLRFSRGSTTLQAERVMKKFAPCSDGTLKNARLEAERAKQEAWRLKSSAGGTKSAQTRKGGSPLVGTVVQPPLEPNGQPKGNSPLSTLHSPNKTPIPPSAGTVETPPALPPRPSALDGFDDFWKLYPNKQGKLMARKRWSKLSVDDKAAVLAHLPKRIATDPQWSKDDGAFIPHPATFLNQRRWEDDFFKKPEKGSMYDPENMKRMLEEAL